jgi:hypothetical protein
LIVNLATKDGFFTFFKLSIKPLARISFYTAMDLTTWMLVVFGTISYIKGLERTFHITPSLGFKARKVILSILKNGG